MTMMTIHACCGASGSSIHVVVPQVRQGHQGACNSGPENRDGASERRPLKGRHVWVSFVRHLTGMVFCGIPQELIDTLIKFEQNS